MKALVLLLACLPYLGGLPAEAQEEETAQQGIKVYTTNDGVIFISNLDGGEERKLTDGYGAALSPDQRQVAFGRDADLYLLNLETMEEKVIVDHKEYDLNHIVQPIWHPNGRLIFFHEPARLFEEIIYSVEIDGSNLKLLAQYGYFPYYSWPSPFSPDGRKFLFNDCFDACSSLLIYDIDDDIRRDYRGEQITAPGHPMVVMLPLVNCGDEVGIPRDCSYGMSMNRNCCRSLAMLLSAQFPGLQTALE